MTIENYKNINPFISVVICAYSSKRFDLTMNCINSVLGNGYENYEMILVIDGNHGLCQKIESKVKGINNITVVENSKNEGASFSRNRGIELANGDIIAFIDDDGYANSDWMKRIAKDFYDYPYISVVGGKLLPSYENGSEKLPEELLWMVGGTYKGHVENRKIVRNVFTGNMAVKKDVFKDVNFEIIYGKKNNLSHQLEDTLFCVKLNNKRPNSVLYDPEIVAYHHVPRERLKLKYLFKRAFSEGILKAKLEYIYYKNNDNKVMHIEQNYLKVVLYSILKNFYRFKFKDCLLLSFTVLNVFVGYSFCILKERLTGVNK
jgi:glycosyltransferase involved in cell wall biosynthesis